MTQEANNYNLSTSAATSINMEPARLMNESYEDYRTRRKAMAKITKKLKHGTEFHDAQYAGTYENPAKRVLQAERKARRENKRNTV